MVGKGRHPVLGLTSDDLILSVVAPIGLAAAAGTALVVDLASARLDGASRSLRDLVVDGPTMGELSPGRKGVAIVPGGDVAPAEAIDVIDRLASRWPAIVIRVEGGDWPFPVVPVVPLFPGRLAPPPSVSHGVWQPVGGGANPPGPGPVLPRLRPGTLRRLLAGRMPRRDRWVEAWRPIWEMPWA